MTFVKLYYLAVITKRQELHRTTKEMQHLWAAKENKIAIKI